MCYDEMPMPPQLARTLLAVASTGTDSAVVRGSVRITPREQEVLILLVDGLSNKQIARRLKISLHGANAWWRTSWSRLTVGVKGTDVGSSRR
jgi:two-component system nitrate/nitrite response regulator NarL